MYNLSKWKQHLNIATIVEDVKITLEDGIDAKLVVNCLVTNLDWTTDINCSYEIILSIKNRSAIDNANALRILKKRA